MTSVMNDAPAPACAHHYQRPVRSNAGSLIRSIIKEESKSLKVFQLDAERELKSQGVRIDRKRPRHPVLGEESHAAADGVVPRRIMPAAVVPARPISADVVKMEEGEEGGDDDDNDSKDGEDRMPGCSKCSFSKDGCPRCLSSPMVTKPKIRWDPSLAHTQKDIPAAETVFPTKEQFADPLAYIESIRHLGEKCGVVCIVPPAGWEPPFALESTAAGGGGAGGEGGSHDGSLRFQVRKQFTSQLCMRQPSGVCVCQQTAAGGGSAAGSRMAGSGGGGGRMAGGGGGGGRMAGGGSRSGMSLSPCAVSPRSTGGAVRSWSRLAPSATAPPLFSVSVSAAAERLPACAVDEAMLGYPVSPLPGEGRPEGKEVPGLGAGEAELPSPQQPSGTGRTAASPGDAPASSSARDKVGTHAAPGRKTLVPSVSIPLAGAAAAPPVPAAVTSAEGLHISQLSLARSYLLPHPLLPGEMHLSGVEDEAREQALMQLLASEGGAAAGASPDSHLMRSDAAPSSRMPREARRLSCAASLGSGGSRDELDGETTETASEDEGVHRRRRGAAIKAAAAGKPSTVAPDSGTDDDDGHFGHDILDEQHTLRSFMAYAEWSKSMHFGRQDDAGSTGPTSSSPRGSWVPDREMDPAPRQGPRPADDDGEEGGGPSLAQLEAEFWRIVEDPSHKVETLYGSDLDSGRHGSGFPLPLWRGTPMDLDDAAASAPPLQQQQQHEEYRRHPWNINCLTRSRGSVLRYIKCKELVTGVMMPWLYVGSCLSAFCWHVEDHALYSINYLHKGAPKVWYGVPSCASEAFDDAMRDALPHLFAEDPLILHRLVTMLSPNELTARGIPVHRLVHHAGSFVVTFPNAYHAGFNTGFNCAEAVNFAPPDWLPHGSDVVRKYRTQSKALTISHDQLLLTLVAAAPLVAAAKARKLAAAAAGGAGEEVDGGGEDDGDDDLGTGVAPHGAGGWMRQWADGASLRDVPERSVLLAVAELALRVDEEGTRRRKAWELGVRQEVRMSSSEEAERDDHGIHIGTADCDCEVCKCDLYLSAVVSERVPGRCVCPEHAEALGVPSSSCKLLYRNTLDELFDVLQHATDVFPEAGLYVEAARARIKAAPTIVARKLGPILTPAAAGPWKEQLGRQPVEAVAAGPSADDRARTVVPAAPQQGPSKAAAAADKRPPQQSPTESAPTKRTSGRSRGGRKMIEPIATAPEEAVAAPPIGDGLEEAELIPLLPPGADGADVPLLVPGLVSHVPRMAAKRSLQGIAPGSIAAAVSLVSGMGCSTGESEGCRPTPACASGAAAAVPSTEASASSLSALEGACEETRGASDVAPTSNCAADAAAAPSGGGPWWTVLLGEGGEPAAAAPQSGGGAGPSRAP